MLVRWPLKSNNRHHILYFAKYIVKGVSSRGFWGCSTFLEFVSILEKYVGKISWPNVVGKFGVFYHKKRNAEFYQYSVPRKSNFYRRWRLLKKLYIRSVPTMMIMNI